MVLKTELCHFCGAKIYSVRGIRFIRADSQVFLYANSKCKHYFHNRLKPSKLTWTAMYRKQHKKKKIAERPEVRDAALREIKERIKKTKDEKKTKKAEVMVKSQKAGGKGNLQKAGSKGPKLGGDGGKR
ncbi:60S ribosomal protein L24 [Capsicum annuum]|uniref:60S ribosomal protein L24 n=1 Tax=Capsicum annuum TaxID=4072 RepID=A0A2G2YDR8_CAPAN|nr:60S ribosomal protein L24 [Capsicum annuum]